MPQCAPMTFLTEFRDVMIELGWYPGSTPGLATFRERVEAQAKLPLSFQPGTEFEYHVGYPVIGVVIETVVGKTLEAWPLLFCFAGIGLNLPPHASTVADGIYYLSGLNAVSY
jgi:hypothetical protein